MKDILKQPEFRAYLSIHTAVIAYGFTAILGALISISAFSLVWWRLVLTVGTLIIIYYKSALDLKNHRPHLRQILFSGIIITLHWICFYASIKLSNASVAVVVLATIPVFTSFLGPLINKSAFDIRQLLTAILIIPGMVLIVNNISLEMQWGIWVGLLSAFFSSLFTVLSKPLVDAVPLRTLSFGQLASGLLFLTICLPVFHQLDWLGSFKPLLSDWVYLGLLSIFCTTIAFILSGYALRVLNPFIINLTINLEPLYGVFLAIVLLKEHRELNWGFYTGMFIILAAVFMYPLLTKRKMPVKYEPHP